METEDGGGERSGYDEDNDESTAPSTMQRLLGGLATTEDGDDGTTTKITFPPPLGPAVTPASASALASQARVVLRDSVGIGLHEPSGCYVLFLVGRRSRRRQKGEHAVGGTIQRIPTCLVRFDRSGQDWDGVDSCGMRAADATAPPGAWDEATAAVMLAALEADAKTEGSHEDEEKGDASEVIDESLDAQTIRRIIVDDILATDHPSPEYMLQVATAMADCLKHWADMIDIRPPLPVLDPVFPEQAMDTEEKNGEDDDSIPGQQAGIIVMRDRQGGEAADMARRCLGRLSSIVCAAKKEDAESASDASMQLGRDQALLRLGEEAIGAAVALSTLQRRHRAEWCNARWYDDGVFIDIWEENGLEDDDCGLGEIIAPWRENAGSDLANGVVPSASGTRADGRVEKVEAEPEDLDGVGLQLFRAWMRADNVLRSMLAEAMHSAREELLNSINLGCRFVEATERRIEEWAQGQRAATDKLVRKYAAIFDECGDEEGEEEDADLERTWLLEHVCKKVWTDTEAEAMELLAEGEQKSSEVQSNAQVDLVVDTRLVKLLLKKCMAQVTGCGKYNARDRSPDLSRQLNDGDDKQRVIWDYYMRQPLDDTRSMIRTLLNEGGQQSAANAARLLVVVGDFLCSSTNAITLVNWSEDSGYDNYMHDGSKDYILDLLRNEMSQFDADAVNIALSLFPPPTKALLDGSHSPPALTRHVSPWLCAWFESGRLSLPRTTESMWKSDSKLHGRYGDKKEVLVWKTYVHPAGDVLRHNGWQNPGLRKTLQGNESASRQWRGCERIVVAKARLQALENAQLKEEAVAMARTMGGDPSALRLLISNGYVDAALSQASSSGSDEGLATLADEMRNSDPCSSFLCAQAQLLRAIEKEKQEFLCRPRYGHEQYTPFRGEKSKRAAIFLVKRFLKSFLLMERDGGPLTGGSIARITPLSLHNLSLAACLGIFRGAASSTADMQAVFESKPQLFKHNQKLLGVAAIAVIFRVGWTKAIELVLENSGLLTYDSYNTLSTNGMLIDFNVHTNIEQRENICVCLASLFECSGALLEKGCEVVQNGERRSLECAGLSFLATLISAVHLAFHCRRFDFLTKLSHMIRGCPYDPYNYDDVSNAIELCFLLAHESEAVQAACPELLPQILELSLCMKPEKLQERHSGVWFMIAYMELKRTPAAAALVAEFMYSMKSSGGEEWVLSHLKNRGETLLSGTNGGSDALNCTMRQKYGFSCFRPQIGRSCWQDLYLAFVLKLMELYTSDQKNLSPRIIREILRASAATNISLWRLNQERLEERNTGPSLLGSVEKVFFEGECSISACRALFLIDWMRDALAYSPYSRRRDERPRDYECTPHFILLCGLKWLQKALAGESYFVTLPEGFDDQLRQSTCLLSGLTCVHWRTVFEDWRPDCDWWERDKAINTPCGAAFALATIVQHHAESLQPGTRCKLRHICSEALFLCASLKFLMVPDVESYRHAVSLWNSRTMSSVYDPRKLLDKVLRPEWGEMRSSKGEVVDNSVSEKEKSKNSDYLVCLPPLPKSGVVEAASSVKKNRKNSASFVPLLEQRVTLALDQNQLSSAISLCRHAGQAGAVWNASGGLCTELLQLISACLQLFKALAKRPQVNVGDVTTVALHALISTNWLNICGNGKAQKSHYAQSACSRTVLPRHVDLPHACAAEWEGKTNDGIEGASREFVDMVQSLSNCCRAWDCVTALDPPKSCKGCTQAQNIFQELPHDGNKLFCRHSREIERARKKQRTTGEMESFVGPQTYLLDMGDNILVQLRELKSVAQKLHIPEAKFWFEAAEARLVAARG